MPDQISINEAVKQITEITRLKAKCYSFPSNYSNFGFMVKYKVIPKKLINDADIAGMKALFEKASPNIVFNSMDIGQIRPEDAERFQIVSKEYQKIQRGAFTIAQKLLLETCENAVVGIVGKLLPHINKFKTVESVLFSRDHSQERQKLHADLDDALANSGALAIVALEPHTTFIICRKSHKSPEVLETDNVRCFPRVYELGIGDILIFHPNLVHAGDKYTKSNLRVHYYVLDHLADYQLDVSYHVMVDISRKYLALAKNQSRRIRGTAEALSKVADKDRKRSRANTKNSTGFRASERLKKKASTGMTVRQRQYLEKEMGISLLA